MRDFSGELAALGKRVDEAERYLDVAAKRVRVGELEQELQEPDLWNDQERARGVQTEHKNATTDVELVAGLRGRLDDVEVLFELARDESDESQEPEIERELSELAAELDRVELRSLFTGEHDERDAVCSIYAGEGGTDAQDWAEMLLRMYLRWAERRGFDTEIDEASPGREAGLQSATFIVKGRHAYGLLSAEQGTHRLVRISPFDANARRQTSFAGLEVVPMLDEAEAPVIEEKDLRIDTYRSSGAGGQHVNVTDSAVRITHLPTGIVVSCQNERSQMQNKARALQVLAAKLADRQREERAAELEAIAGPTTTASMGTQIRSYVLAPYQLVKDLRTEYETGNVDAVLDGDLDPFMEVWLRWRRTRAEQGA